MSEFLLLITSENLLQPQTINLISEEDNQLINNSELEQLLISLKEIEQKQWQDLIKSNRLSDIENFAQKLGELNKQYNYPPLNNYLKKLQEELDCFNLIELTTIIQNFPQIINCSIFSTE